MDARRDLDEHLARLQAVVDATKAWGDTKSDDHVAVLAAEMGMALALAKLQGGGR